MGLVVSNKYSTYVSSSAAEPFHAVSLAAYPVTPNDDDDEFDSNTLASPWAWSSFTNPNGASVTPAASTITTYSDVGGTGAHSNSRYALNSDGRRSWLLSQTAGNGATLFLTKAITPATNMLIWARCGFRAFNGAAVNNESTVGITLTGDASGYADGANALFVQGNESDTGIRQAAFISGASNVFTDIGLTLDVDPNGAQAFEYLAIHKLGTTYHGWVCSAAGNWMWLGSVTNSVTVARMGITFAGGTVNNKPGTLVQGVDFIRRIDTAEFLL